MSGRTNRSDHKFRLIFSLFGLTVMVAGLIFRGEELGIGALEVIVIATLFFGGTIVYSARKLLKESD